MRIQWLAACIFVHCMTAMAAAQTINILEAFDGPTQLVSNGGPADCAIAVSDDYVFVAVNHRYQVYDRNNGFALLASVPLGDFFGSASDGFDPRVIYDAATDRFVLIGFRQEGLTRVAWSDPGAPLPLGVQHANWAHDDTSMFIFNILCGVPPPEDVGHDQPALGSGALAWYVEAPAAACAGVPEECDGADRAVNAYYIIPKPPQGSDATQIIGPILSNEFIDSETGQPLACWRTTSHFGHDERTMPARHYGDPPAAYFVGAARPRPFSPVACANGDYYELRIMGIVNPLDAQQRQLWAYHLPVPCYGQGTLDIPTGCGEFFNAIDARITSVVWRNIGGVETLWATHDVLKYVVENGDAHVRKVIRWYKIATNGWPVSGNPPTLLDTGEIDAGYGPSNKHLCYPGLSVNAQGDMAIIVARSGRFENISIQAAGRLAGSPPGQVGPLKTVKLSSTCSAPYNGKWGDYFTVVPDPSGDGTFWGFAMYMIDVESTDPHDYWGTWIFHFEIAP